MKRITFSQNSWADYISWQSEDRKMLKKINELIKDIERTPYKGLGRPEALKYDFNLEEALSEKTEVFKSIKRLKFNAI